MIGTVTINPSIDQHMLIDKLVKDDAIRVREIKRYPGGKGINVSRAIKELGGETVAFSIAGGCVGYMLKSLIAEQEIPFEAVDVLEETRINVIITDASDRTQTRLHASGPFTTLDISDRFFSRISGYQPLPEWWVLGGSLPPGTPTDFYAEFIRFFRENGAKCLLDADADALKLGIEAKPYLIKPNEYEMSRLVGRPLKDEASIIEAAREIIISTGVEVVAVTLGRKGALVVTKESVFRATSPDIEVKSKVGAGDSFLAGCVLALSKGQPIEEAVRLGMAAGTAAVMNEGTTLCRRGDVERMIRQIVIEKMEHKSVSPVKPSQKKLDVVCGMHVDPTLTSFEAGYEGEHFWFCSLNCKEKFLKNPKRYSSIGPTNDRKKP